MQRIELDGLKSLTARLHQEGYIVVGPRVRAGAITYAPLQPDDEWPVGWNDTQDAGSYRIHRSESGEVFGYAVGPHSWKQFLHLPSHPVVAMRRSGKGFSVQRRKNGEERFAFLGVRSCDLHAIHIQDVVLSGRPSGADDYRSVRERVLIVAVNCTRPGKTCFCSSMKTGPEVISGFDLLLTECDVENDHFFLVRSGSDRGADLLKSIHHRPASDAEIQHAQRLMARSAESMGRTLMTDGLETRLADNIDHPRWQEIARRCLTCGNCTLVCPTCFCSTIEDTTDLSGTEAVRTRRWDSCFTLDFSYIHGGSVRASAMARYRQWLTHKLSRWVGQFGTFGCVGCGRCITWCPVGIDITEEAKKICGE